MLGNGIEVNAEYLRYDLSMKSFFFLLDGLHRKYRFLIALLLGCLVFGLVRKSESWRIASLYGWICFAGVLLFFSWITILLRHPKQTGSIAREQDASAVLVFLLVVCAAFFSLFAIIYIMRGQALMIGSKLNLHVVLSLVCIVLSWLLIHSVFTIRYAHLYYDFRSREKKAVTHAGGLQFPSEEQPDFLDFAYFSFVLAMTFQTADVSITGRRIRRLALLHGLLAFVYNTSIIALVINIVSGLIGK